MLRIKPDQKQRVSLTVNGKPVSGYAAPRMLLTDFLRHELGMYGTHVGCEHGVCGACTAIIDGAATRSCLRYAVQCDGMEIQTVEGLADADGTTRAYGSRPPLGTMPAVDPAGGGMPHENMQPFIAMYYCIALQGVFPSRN